MRRSLFDDDHEAFRAVVRAFYAEQVVPEYAEWEAAGAPPRHFWTAAGKLGLLGIQVPEEFGGGGQTSFLFNVILTEEAQHAGIALGGLRVHTDIAMPYFLRLANHEQQARWLPRLVNGDAVAALAMSEAGAGSDVKALTTRATRDGDTYIVNGSKTFISNGANADLIITAVKTDPSAGRDGLSLLVIEGDSPGLTRGRKLEKLGLKAQDLAELSFDDVVVPAENLLGARRPRLPLPDGEPGPGTVVDSGQQSGRGRQGTARHRRIHQGPQGIWHHGGVVSEHQVRTRRLCDRYRGRPIATRPGVGRARTAVSCPPPTPRWSSCSVPSCRAASSIGACSCMAATAT